LAQFSSLGLEDAAMMMAMPMMETEMETAEISKIPIAAIAVREV